MDFKRSFFLFFQKGNESGLQLDRYRRPWFERSRAFIRVVSGHRARLYQSVNLQIEIYSEDGRTEKSSSEQGKILTQAFYHSIWIVSYILLIYLILLLKINKMNIFWCTVLNTYIGYVIRLLLSLTTIFIMIL